MTLKNFHFCKYSHEMQHYLSALQNYISNQVIQVTWEELQKKLNQIQTIEDLIEVHNAYVKNALSRYYIIIMIKINLRLFRSFLNLIIFILLL